MAHHSIPTGATGTATGLIREVRPQQWYKQGVLLLGIVFSRNLFDLTAWLDVIAAMVAFTAVAGATYIFNDISDIEADRRHPEKRHRPIASGQVSVPVGASFAAVLLTGGLAAAAAVNWLVAAVLGVYLAQNLVYSVFLKDIVLVDILVVATGFVLRAIAGVVAIAVYLSPWLIVCTFLLALVLAIGKRRHELATLADPDATRETLGRYTHAELDQLLNVVMATLLMSYALYTFFRATPAMMLTLPFAFYGIFRYHHLVHTTDIAGNPEYLLADRAMMANLAFWGLVTIAVLYGATDLVTGGLP